jgi:peptide/nickel transport system substrate-binding protein
MFSSRVRRTAALLLATALVAACGSDDGEEGGAESVDTVGGTAPADGGGENADAVVVVSIPQDEGTLTPFTHTTAPPALDLVWDTLLVNDTENRLHPLVAESYELSDDLTTYTFTIREGMTWHDGEPLTVDDVVFSFEYQQEFGFATGGLQAAVASVEAVDESTVVLTLTEPNSDFEQNVLASVKMIPEHVFADVADPMTAGIEVAIGSGPYRITEYVPDQRYRLEANVDYVPGPPTVGVIEMPIIPQASTAFSALRTGEVDMSSVPLDTQLIGDFEGADGVELIQGSFFSPQLMVINAERAPLNDADLRMAISRAIDVQELIDVVALGVATPPNAGFLHPRSPLVTDVVDHVYDPEEAARILGDLGAVAGDDGVRVLDSEPLSFTLLVDSIETNSVRVAEITAEMLAEVGIEVTVEPIESQTVYDRVWPEFDVANGRDFDLTMFSWQPVLQTRAGRFGGLVHSDPTRGSLNIGGFSDPAADELVDAIDDAPDEATRLDAVQGLSELIAEEVPFVTLYFPDTTFAYRPESFDGWQYREGLGPFNTSSFVDYQIF